MERMEGEVEGCREESDRCQDVVRRGTGSGGGVLSIFMLFNSHGRTQKLESEPKN